MKKRFAIIWSLIAFTLSAFGQDGSIQAHFEATPLHVVLDQLEEEYGLKFSFMIEDIEGIDVSVKRSVKDIDGLMELILADEALDFDVIEEDYIVIKKAKPIAKICGYIKSLDSDDLLPFANVLIDGTYIGTSADETGRFELAHRFKAGDRVTISYIGFESVSLTFEELKGDNCPTISLRLPEFEEAFLIIKDYITDGVSLTENGSSTDIDLRRVGNLPGQVEADVLRTIQFLPGVSAPSSRSSDIYIRGCTPDQNLITWEDIPMYHSAHYFGMISAFNPYIIDDLKVYRGGFDAEYGGRIGGVIAMTSPDEKDGDSYVGVGSNMTHAYTYGFQKLGLENPTSITFSARRSFAELVETPTFRNISKINQQGYIIGNKEIALLPSNIKIKNDFDFIDTHLKVASQLGNRDHVSASGFYIRNDFTDRITDNNLGLVQRDSMQLNNIGASLRWNHHWSDQVHSSFKAIGTSYDYAYDYKLKEIESGDLRVRGTKSNTIQDLQFQFRTQYKTDRQQLISLGYQFIDYAIDYNVVEDTPKGGGKDIHDRGSSDASVHSVFMEFKNPIRNKLGISAGLRSSIYGIGQELLLEPRIGLAYQWTSAFSMNANYGRYCQFVGQVTEFRGNNNGLSLPLWALAERESISIQASNNAQLGMIFQQNSWTVDVQGYTRAVEGLSSRAYDFEQVDEGPPSTGSASIRGVDVMVKKRFRNIRSWLSYSYSKTHLEFQELAPASFPSDFDQNHVLHWSNQIDLNPFSFSLGFRLASGLPYSRLIDYEITSDPNEVFEYDGIYDGINQYTLPATHEINLSAGYDFGSKNDTWKGFIQFSISNVLNRENIYSRNYYVDSRPNQHFDIDYAEKTNIRFNPNLSIRFEW